MSSLPLYTLLKPFVVMVTLSWCIAAAWDLLSQRSTTRIKVFFHACTLLLLSLFLLFYAAAERRFPLSNTAESFIVAAWFYIAISFPQACKLNKRSLDGIFAPFPSIIMLLGISFLDTFKNNVFTQLSPLAQLLYTFMLISLLSYFYGFLLAIIGKAVLNELKFKQTLNLTLKLPELRQLKRSTERFLCIGACCFSSILLYLFVLLPLKLDLHLLVPLNLPIAYFIAGGSSLLTLCLMRLNRISQYQLLFFTAFSMAFALIHLFTLA